MKPKKNLGKILKSISIKPVRTRAYQELVKRNKYTLNHLGPGSYVAYSSKGSVRSANLL